MKGLKNKAKKYMGKQIKRGVAFAKKRYTTKGKANVGAIVKDVMMLKRMINVEKKRVDNSLLVPASFGASAGAGVSGYYATIITPSIAQGLTGATRNGNSLKITSACIDLFFGQSVNTVNQVKIRYTLFDRVLSRCCCCEIDPFSL